MVVAILFNPIIPFHFDRDAWMVIDLITGVLMLTSLSGIAGTGNSTSQDFEDGS